MKIKSISDIHNAIFHPLKLWAEQSTGNWNILIGVGFYCSWVVRFLPMYFIRRLGKTMNGQIKSF